MDSQAGRLTIALAATLFLLPSAPSVAQEDDPDPTPPALPCLPTPQQIGEVLSQEPASGATILYERIYLLLTGPAPEPFPGQALLLWLCGQESAPDGIPGPDDLREAISGVDGLLPPQCGDPDGPTDCEPWGPDGEPDGMDDRWEDLWECLGGDGQPEKDPDEDGLVNRKEYQWQTDPCSPDTDVDLWEDGPEAAHWQQLAGFGCTTLNLAGFTFSCPLSRLDTDGDGKPNIRDPDSDDDALMDGTEAHEIGTVPEAPDTDGDGLLDGGYAGALPNLRGNVGEWHDVGTDPLRRDTDGDGLQDGAEVDGLRSHGVTDFRGRDTDGDAAPDVLDADADGDGLEDGPEAHGHRTDPQLPDTDADLMPDGWEVEYGLQPTVDDAGLDGDRDNAAHVEEYCWPMEPDACGWDYAWGPWNPEGAFPDAADSDLDLALDGDEMADELDPRFWDTDGDGMPDGWELRHGLNPHRLQSWDAGLDSDGDSADVGDDGAIELWFTNLDEYEYARPAGWSEAEEGAWLYGTHPKDPDTDDDQGPDGWEVLEGTDPRVGGDFLADDDQDGLNLTLEMMYGTDPQNPDSDGDGLCDGGRAPGCEHPLGGQEAFPGELDYLTDPTWADSDLDGWSDGEEAAYWDPTGSTVLADIDEDGVAGPADSDSDDDGLLDGAERDHQSRPEVEDTDADRILDGEEVGNFRTEPALEDTDGDGLLDGDEAFTYMTDGTSSDTEQDGLSDGQEILRHRSNPLVTDTDSDGMDDLWEAEEGTAVAASDGSLDLDQDGLPNLGEYRAGTKPATSDTDGDSLEDGFEVDHGLDPLDPGDEGVDTDGDGLDNAGEVQVGTLLAVADSDGDGLSDGLEAATAKSDPLGLDSDSDGIDDGDEWGAWQAIGPTAGILNHDGDAFPTGLTDADSDNDGLTDGEEFLSTRTRPDLSDTDGDTLSDHQEVVQHAGKYDPKNEDTDGDGLTDAKENSLLDQNADVDGDGLRDDQELLTYHTSPLLKDSDCDGILDGPELRYWGSAWNTGTNRLLEDDVDGDTILDGVELGRVGSTGVAYRMRPDLSDTDGDGLGDDEEAQTSSSVACETLPVPRLPGLFRASGLAALFGGAHGPSGGLGSMMQAQGSVGTNPTRRDTDGDGLTDSQEVQEGTNPTDCDSDDDGLGDGLEMGVTASQAPLQRSVGAVCAQRDLHAASKTDPLSSDSDEDGLPDSVPASALGLIGEDVNHDGRADSGESDPTRPDGDGDGLLDKEEFDALGLLRCNLDRDCDGDDVQDGLEVDWHVDTDQDGLINFVDPNSDADGIPDGLDGIQAGPLGYGVDTDGDLASNMVDRDSDDDGFPDGAENRGLANVLTGFDTNPLLADTDGDGVPDGRDLQPLMNAAETNLLSLDLDEVRIYDHVDPFSNEAEFYIGKLEITADEEGRISLFELTLENAGETRAFSRNNKVTVDGHKSNFGSIYSFNLPHDLGEYPDLTGGTATDLKVYLWIGAYDLDPSGIVIADIGNDDERLDISEAKSHVDDFEGRTYRYEISLRRDPVSGFTQLERMNGNLDGSRGGWLDDQEDAKIVSQFSEAVPLDVLLRLLDPESMVAPL